MTDRRFWAANAHVAHTSLAGTANVDHVTDGTPKSVSAPITDLCAKPAGARDKQLLFGQPFTVLEIRNGWAFGFDPTDGYCGHVLEADLGPFTQSTHKVWARHTHSYAEPDIKAPQGPALSFLSHLRLADATDDFLMDMDAAETGQYAYVPRQHVQPLSHMASDPTAMAKCFLGTPYLWGGNSGTGIDCSGLTQLALIACGIPCPRDSDLQADAFPSIDPDTRQRGDLIFWKGHVGMLLDPDTLIHANAFHMCTAIEPLDQAIKRIAQKEFGEVTGYARPVSVD